MLSFLKKFADVSNPKSVSNRFRTKRFKYFLELINELPKPVKILDAGGTQLFWERMKLTSPEDVQITILNKENVDITLPNFTMVKGNAADMKMFTDMQFDVVFSNSVIEHVGSFDSQRKMANEIMRTGKTFFVQTPNYYFPLEPHFLFPFFQFLPNKLKIFLIRHFSLGWYEKVNNIEKSKEIINSLRLLNLREIKELFPNSVIIKEKFIFLTKSFIILRKIR